MLRRWQGLRASVPLCHLRPRTPVTAVSFSTTTACHYLAGTVAYHRSYVLLHSHKPPSEFPSKPTSRLQKALQLTGIGIVNFSWSPNQPVHEKFTGLGDDPHQPEIYCATAFSATRGRIFLEEVSMANLADVSQKLEEHASPSTQPGSPPNSIAGEAGKLHIYVCTHGARDCRCGETGGEVVQAFRDEAAKRGILDQVLIGDVAHVGGHKYAANVLVFPFGDWLGTIQSFDVPNVLDEFLERSSSAQTYQNSLPPLCPPFWRGRMGLDKNEQLALHAAAT